MKKEKLFHLFTLAVLASLLLSACGGATRATSDEDKGYYGDDAIGEGGAEFLGAPEPAMEAPEADFAAEESMAQEEGARSADLGNVQANRLVIKNASMTVVVDDPAAALDR
ncbi:MAG TPA: hypothetical protein VF982_03255, partial [Anaerolineales bacterium]